jgi:hypothetical protein
MLRGGPGSIESIPTVSGRQARLRPFGLRMETEGSRDCEKARDQQDDLCGAGFSQCVEHR